MLRTCQLVSVVGRTQLLKRKGFSSCLDANLLKRKIPDIFWSSAQTSVWAHGGGSWWGKSAPRKEKDSLLILRLVVFSLVFYFVITPPISTATDFAFPLLLCVHVLHSICWP